MKKIYFLLTSLILIVIISPFFVSQEKTKYTSELERQLSEIQPKNPGTNPVRVLGKTTEIEEEKQTQETIFDKSTLYSLINSHRKNNKLTPLNINDSLEISAERKVKDMIENDYFRHQDKYNIESWYLFQAAGYNYETAGENLSSGSNSPWKVFDAWLTSEEHNSQMLSNTFLDMGLSVDCDSYKIGRKASCIAVLHLGSR